MYFDSPHPLSPTAGPHKLHTSPIIIMTVKFRRNLWQYQKGNTCMLSLFTAMDIYNIHQMGSKSGKRSTCKGGKNIK